MLACFLKYSKKALILKHKKLEKVSEPRNTVKHTAEIFGFIFHNAPGVGWEGRL